ncbi:hypothetical protein Dsin_021443 [Dipteronia sinensis]|uniref:Uncharacterized protein n=1 Tax=Dipteronia sinensis TaxID=43782 RepID=A0AAD9ZZJ5_9ROSI|nr:hypothetical protein Dsin_021443 [Dipteronia sinensis]
MLAYGVPTDSTNENIKIEESTTIESMKRFCQAIVGVFVERYMRSPNANNVARLLQTADPATPKPAASTKGKTRFPIDLSITIPVGSYARVAGPVGVIMFNHSTDVLEVEDYLSGFYPYGQDNLRRRE